MKKKIIWIVAICAVLLISGSIYVHPIALSDNVEADNTLSIQIIVTGVRNGETYADTKGRDIITGQQKEDIMLLLQKYFYQKSLKTYISSNTMEQIGNRSVFLYIYDGDTLLHTICVTDSGQITVDDRLYQMKNARQFNDEIEDTVRQTY